MRPELPDWKPGDRASAAKLNKLLSELRRLARISVAPPLEIIWGAAGVMIRLKERRAVIDQFPAIIYDKRSVSMTELSSDPLFINPECPPVIATSLKYGKYSWMEGEEPDDDGDIQRVKPKPNGRFGNKNECDAAVELNRTNTNIHVEKMVVLMYQGIAVDCSSAEEDPSSISAGAGRTVHALSTNFRYWFDLNIPREDCANRYVISSSPANDFPSP